MIAHKLDKPTRKGTAYSVEKAWLLLCYLEAFATGQANQGCGGCATPMTEEQRLYVQSWLLPKARHLYAYLSGTEKPYRPF